MPNNHEYNSHFYRSLGSVISAVICLKPPRCKIVDSFGAYPEVAIVFEMEEKPTTLSCHVCSCGLNRPNKMPFCILILAGKMFVLFANFSCP